MGGLVPQHHCFWSLETTRHEPKSQDRRKVVVDVFVKLRERKKKNQPPKLYVVTLLIFQIKRTIQSEIISLYYKNPCLLF